MTLYDFIKLDDEEQAEAVWQGNFLAFRVEKKYQVLLYKMPSFYVEVYYNKDLNLIEKLRPFKTPTLLQQYFDAQLN